MDRVDEFIGWVRRHRYASLIVIASLILGATVQLIQSATTLSTYVLSFANPPPPVSVDLFVGHTTKKGFEFSASVVNIGTSPLFIQCVGVHINNGGVMKNIWLHRNDAFTKEGLAAGAKSSWSAFPTIFELGVSPDQDPDYWLSVESNSETIFESETLINYLNELGRQWDEYRPGEIPIGRSWRLEHVAGKKLSTHTPCTTENRLSDSLF